MSKPISQKQLAHLEKLSAGQLKKYGLVKADIAKLKILIDPVKWVSTHLRDPEDPRKKFVPRPMQQEIIALDHPKIAIRAARRTGKSVAIAARAVYHAFTEPNIPILIVAPYIAQIKEIFGDISRLTDDSPTVGPTIVRQVQFPAFEMTFSNKSVIRGMCTGSTPGRRGSSLRGQGAKYIYVDEFDYMDEESLKALIMIRKTRADTELFVTGTPSGVRSWFYLWCTKPEKYGFVAKHYSKEHIPSWTAEDEDFYREHFNEAAYKHEVLAEFADEAVQVFASAYIDSCLVDFEPENLKWSPERQYGIGVDWNSAETGCHIVVMEYIANAKPTKDDVAFLSQLNAWRAKKNQQYREKIYTALDWGHFHKKLRFFRHTVASGVPFAQHEAVRAIIEAYKLYHPKFIWVDEGHGEVQVELLHKWALDNGDKVLPKILRSCNFSSTIEIADPFKPSTRIKKRFKAYMVQTVQRYLEQLDFILPLSADDKNKIVGQLRAYTVEKFTAAKEPVFSTGNDHILDAMMLAVLGFEHNFGLLTGRRASSSPATIRHMPMVRGINMGSRDENPAEKPAEHNHRVVTNRDEFYRDKKSPSSAHKIHFNRIRIPFRRWSP